MMNMDYVSCSNKKKKNKLVQKLFPKKARKKDAKDDVNTEFQGSLKQTDEETWARIKKMEEKRQILAMKNHIEELESQLSAFQAQGSKGKHGCPVVVPDRDVIQSEENSVVHNSVASKNKLGVEDSVNVKPNGKKKWKNIAMKHLRSKRLFKSSLENVNASHITSEKTVGRNLTPWREDKEIPIEDGDDEDVAESFAPPERPLENCVDAEDEFSKNAGVTDGVNELDKSRVQDEVEEYKIVRESSAPPEWQLQGTRVDAGDVTQQMLRDNELSPMPEDSEVDSLVGEIISCESPSCDTDWKKNEAYIDCTIDNTAECESSEEIDPLEKPHISANNISNAHSQDAIAEDVCVQGFIDNCQTRSLEPDRTVENTISKLSELQAINENLKMRISALEEEVSLADEDKRNMQITLERQKDKAIKNLALKFEEINRKTLCEFKAIFERKLKDINDEKILLQEKLEKADEIHGESFDMLYQQLKNSEEKAEKLEKGNTSLKKRCRKFSADLGKLKREHKMLLCKDGETSTSTQTNIVGSENKATQTTEDVLQCSVDCLQSDVTNIAVTISKLSENIEGQTQRWIDFVHEKRDSLGDVSEQSDIDSRKSDTFSKETDCDDPNESFETAKETNIDKAANISSDDGDSGIFGSELSQNLESDIESQLSRVENKYRKLKLELEKYESSKLERRELSNPENFRRLLFGDPREKPDLNSEKRQHFGDSILDPDIQKLIEEVNKQYNDYFNGNIF